MLETPLLAFTGFFLPLLVVYAGAPLYLRFFKSGKAVTENYRGLEVVSAGGLLLWAALGAVQVAGFLWLGQGVARGWLLLLYWSGIAFLGAYDDLRGEKNCKGFRGHLRRFWQGQGISTGLWKAAGGLGLGIWIVAAWAGRDAGGEWLIKGVFLALFTNFFNLLDTRPARAAKVFFLLSFIFTGIYREVFLPLLALWSALYLYLFWELEEKIMLGDAGAYLLGGVLGIYLVQRLSWQALLPAVGVLLVLHYLGEKFSWNRFLENKGFLLRLWQFPGRRS